MTRVQQAHPNPLPLQPIAPERKPDYANSAMYPTLHLRFVLRSDGNREVRTLQQWWVTDPSLAALEPDAEYISGANGEWRDVPLVHL